MLYGVRMPLEASETKILMALLRTGPVPSQDLLKEAKIGSASTVVRAVETLSTLGLVIDEKETRFPRRRMISLSVFGKKAATALMDAENYIEQAQKHAKVS
jgi:DNA-binding MarR family transcriptional regulator